MNENLMKKSDPIENAHTRTRDFMKRALDHTPMITT